MLKVYLVESKHKNDKTFRGRSYFLKHTDAMIEERKVKEDSIYYAQDVVTRIVEIYVKE